MGLTFADIQSMSREATALYPSLDPLPVLTEYSDAEKKICELQIGFASRLRKSQYYVVETTKSSELPRYSDKYRPSTASQPTLKRRDLCPAFFPPDIFDGYFNVKKKRKVEQKVVVGKKRMNIDEMDEDAEEPEKSSDERSDAGSQANASDYDVDEEYDNDYAENYFDNGENDDMDDLGGGGGGGGDGGGDYE
jgi:DNA-directed RNA polymerase III subunit RPC7